MLRLAWILLTVAAVSLVEIVRAWLIWRPFKRWKARRAKKREGHVGDADDGQFFNDEPEEVPMSEAMHSFLRTILKIVGTALVTKGVLDAGDAAAAQVAIEAIAGGVVGLVGVWLSHRKHAAA